MCQLCSIENKVDRSSIERLSCTWCENMYSVNLADFKALKHLELSYCDNLTEIRGLEFLKDLEYLFVNNCESLKSLQVSKLRKLIHLDCGYCHELKELDLSGCVNLEHLNCSDCEKLEYISDLDHSISLEHVDVQCCKKLKNIPKLPESLTSLECSDCSVESIDVSNCKSLRLGCSYCCNLVSVKGLERCKEVQFVGCRSLIYKPELENESFVYGGRLGGCPWLPFDDFEKHQDNIKKLVKLQNSFKKLFFRRRLVMSSVMKLL
jgi:internalin A